MTATSVDRPNQMRFKDKIVLIVGSSRNSGLTAARRFGEEGAKLVINAARSGDELAAAEAELRGKGIDVRAVLADCAKQAEAERLIQTAIDQFGRLDCLVMLHSVRPAHPFSEITGEQWHQTMATNLHSVFYLCKAASPHLIATGNGAIVCAGPLLNYAKPLPPFAVGKVDSIVSLGARGLFLQSIAADFASRGVRVNMVEAGLMDTIRRHPEWYPGVPGGRLQDSPQAISAIPMGRVGTTGELAEAILFLASDQASYTAGAVLSVQGGGYG